MSVLNGLKKLNSNKYSSIKSRRELKKCVILKKNKSAFADQAQSNAIEFQNRVEDKILDKDFITDMNEIINYASDE